MGNKVKSHILFGKRELKDKKRRYNQFISKMTQNLINSTYEISELSK